MKFSACTHIGKIRQLNEDNFYIPQDILEETPLFVVADGMGGHKAGEVASFEAVNEVVKYIKKNFINCKQERQYIINLLKEGIIKANEVVFEKAKINKNLNGMGTTIAVMLVHRKMVYIAHVGDSRIYVIRRNNIYQITRDHSYVEQLIKNGTITRKQASNHPQKNIITRALGIDKDVEIDVSVKRFFDNDTFVLCTDGLTNMVTNEQIKHECLSDKACENITKELVKKANEAGGTDNITVIIVKG